MPTVTLSPSAILIGALLAGFVLYLAKQNRLSVYWGLLFGSSGSSSTSSGSPTLDPTSPNFNPAGVGSQWGTATRQWICRQTGYMCSGTGTGQ